MRLESKIAVGLLSAALAAHSGGAMAGAVATSYVRVTDFQFVNTADNQRIVLGLPAEPGVDFFFGTSTGIQNTGDTNANFNGTSVSTGDFGPVSGAGEFDIDPSCSGPGCSYANNTFTYLGAGVDPTANYVVGDVFLEGAAVDFSPAFSGGLPTPDPATVSSLAEVSIVGEGNGTASGNTIGSSGQFIFTAGAAAEVRVDFNIESFTRVMIDAPSGLATADWNVGITVKKLNDNCIANLPGADCIGFTYGENDAAGPGEDKVVDRLSPAADDSGILSFSGGGAPGSLSQALLSARTFTVVPGETYSVSIVQTSQANANAVPTPAPLVLVGLGLLALGIRRHRKLS